MKTFKFEFIGKIIAGLILLIIISILIGVYSARNVKRVSSCEKACSSYKAVSCTTEYVVCEDKIGGIFALKISK